MTDTTDIAALLEKLNAQTNSYDTVIIKDFEAKQLVAAFEAERQRADAAGLEIQRGNEAGERAVKQLVLAGEEVFKLREENAALKAKLALKSEKLADCESALDKAQTLLMPDGLHENTKALVIGFANAMAAKLYKSEQKYGWSDAWIQDDWQDKCLTDFNHHICKGDPLDVANYCAFMHYHG